MTTGNAVLIEFDGWPWAEVLQSRGRLQAILRPRDL